MRNIYGPTEHELVVEARKLVERLNSEVEVCFVTRAGVDGSEIILEVKDLRKWSSTKLFEKIQQLIDSGKFTIRLSAVTLTENLDDYLPRYEV